MHDEQPQVRGDSCNLSDYGVSRRVVDEMFKSIVWWLEGKDLPWNQTSYFSMFRGPNSRMVAELLFFHYDGPAEREIGSGGENNMCRLYLYDDHCTVNFVGDNSDKICGIHFKYATSWAETDKGLLRYLLRYLDARLAKLFDNDPGRFNGADEEVEHLRSVVDIINGVLNGQVVV